MRNPERKSATFSNRKKEINVVYAPEQMNGAEQKEHQFLNVGLGVHSEVILKIIESRKVKHKTAD